MPSRFAVLAMRQAISPRLAMRTEANLESGKDAGVDTGMAQPS
jgi:hypothetical protein